MQLEGGAAKARQRLAIVVHGDEDGRSLFRTALSVAGFEVITATDGLTALLVAGFTSPALVLLDVDQPALRSLVQARDVRADGSLRHARIIALTGEHAGHEQLDLCATRFDHVLNGPADAQRLLDTIGGAVVTV